MPKSATRTSSPGPWRAAGFTLVELLLVVVIIAVLASTVVLGFFGADREQTLRGEAQRLARLIELARDEAVLRNEELGLVFEEGGYRFVVYDFEADGWRTLDEPPFRARTIDELTVHIEVEGRRETRRLARGEGGRASAREETRPEILILSSGEQTPFTIELAPPAQWEMRSWLIRSDGLSRTSAERAG